jgi:hypothetical protein
VQGQSQIHCKDLQEPQKNRKGRLSDERIRNYGWIIYRKVARVQNWSTVKVNLKSSFDSLGTLQYIIINYNTLMRKSTFPVLLRILASLSDELEINLELWRFIWGQILVADPQSKKWVTKKRLIFFGQKISLLVLHTASPDPGWGLPVKSRNID